MKEESKAIVQDFLLRNSPKLVIKSMEFLAEIKYPINDKYAFDSALESCQDNASKELLNTSFVANDFPMMSTESGLEKFASKFQPFPFPFPIPSIPIELPDFQATPSACDVYRRDFPTEAANCACRTYIEALRDGFNHLQATLIGVAAAKRYVRSGDCGS